MRKNKPELYLAIFIIAVIASTAFLYLQAQETGNYGIFPERLGDLDIALYRDGEVAISEVQNLHGGAVVPDNAYIAVYRSGDGNKIKFWVSESGSREQAESLVSAMNDMVGKTGVFSESTPVTIEGYPAFYVTGLGEYHYFWAKDNNVFWIQVNNPDENYQHSLVKEAIHQIK